MIQRNHFSPLPRARFIHGPVGPRPLLAGLLIVLTVGACGGEESTGPGGEQQPPSVASVAVTPSTAFLLLGETVQLTASASDASGNSISGKTFTWSSSDANAATVSASGVVTALANGSVTIAAAADGVEGTAAIEVGAFRRPLARAFSAMAYDAESDRVILYAGQSEDENDDPIKRGDTWAYDFNTNTWTHNMQ